MNELSKIQELINTLPSEQKQLVSDGYHSFEELYNFRKIYNALIFNEWAKNPKLVTKWAKDSRVITKQVVVDTIYTYDVHKSTRHYDGELCFGGGWFIVSAQLPNGQISNHYKIEDWDLFKIPESYKCKHEFDGHSSKDVVERILGIL